MDAPYVVYTTKMWWTITYGVCIRWMTLCNYAKWLSLQVEGLSSTGIPRPIFVVVIKMFIIVMSSGNKSYISPNLPSPNRTAQQSYSNPSVLKPASLSRFMPFSLASVLPGSR